MYAVIKTGGKQYRVQPGDIVQVEKLEQELGAEFAISDVLMVGGDKTHVGTPTVKNATVTVVVTKQARTKKVFVFKKRRRHGYRRFGTHKQDFTELFIKSISSPDGQVAKTDQTPEVKDMAALRVDRIKQKQEDRRARVEGSIGAEVEAAELSPKPKKAVAKKAKAPKKAAVAKKAKAPSKRSAKKATKTTKKKTK
jgi:large subunit ribosomal protein L21